MATIWQSGRSCTGFHTNRRYFAVRGVAMKRERPETASRSPGTVSPCCHHFCWRLGRLFLSRNGFTLIRTYSKGPSYRHASASVISPKSIIHVSDERRVMSLPFAHGFTTSELGRLLG